MDFAVGRLTRLHGAFSDLIERKVRGRARSAPTPAGGKLSAKLQSIAIGLPATMIPSIIRSSGEAMQTCARLAPLLAIAIIAGMPACPFPALAQPLAGKLEQIRVHGAALDGNLSGDDSTRDVFVYLPPSYARDKSRRYPVVYFLHGYTATAAAYVKFLDLPQAADAAIGNGVREMIVVLPDAFTKWSGSMYSSSVTTGDWESLRRRAISSRTSTRTTGR